MRPWSCSLIFDFSRLNNPGSGTLGGGWPCCGVLERVASPQRGAMWGALRRVGQVQGRNEFEFEVVHRVGEDLRELVHPLRVQGCGAGGFSRNPTGNGEIGACRKRIPGYNPCEFVFEVHRLFAATSNASGS